MNKIKIKNNKINWICLSDKCPKNCCGPYKPNSNSESLWQVNEKLLPLTSYDYKKITKNIINPPVFEQNDCSYYIKTTKDGSCPFLKNNKCSIYKNRFTSCKSYPFFFSKYNGLYADLTCPGWNKGWSSMKTVKEMVKELIKLYKFHMKKAELKLKINKGR